MEGNTGILTFKNPEDRPKVQGCKAYGFVDSKSQYDSLFFSVLFLHYDLDGNH